MGLLQGLNKDVLAKITKGLGIQTAVDKLPLSIAENIQPVFDASPDRVLQYVRGDMIDSGSATITTTSTRKRTFLTRVDLTVAKDVNSPSNVTTLTVQGNEQGALAIATIRHEPLTAKEYEKSVVLDPPLELKKGSNITMAGGSGTASIDVTGTVFFYEVDVI